MAHTFKGFSTVGSDSTMGFKLYDVNLVRQDLLNHFHTRKGERVLRPDFGCSIWDILMEPMTDVNKATILSEAERVCRSDPRVTIINITPSYGDYSVTINFTLSYTGFSSPDQFSVAFDARQGF